MTKPTKVTVSHGIMSKEFGCDLFVGLAIEGRMDGRNCEFLIAGQTDYEGVFHAIRMLKKLEDQLYGILPVPRVLAQLALSMEDSLQNATEKKSTDNNPGPAGRNSKEDLLEALRQALESALEKDSPLEKLLKDINLYGFGGAEETH